jgi:trimeric autotransporter adhesin
VQTLPNALDTILNLRGVSYEWKDSKRREGRQIGFIAQEVEKVLPEIVSTREDGYKGVGYQNVVPVLVEAMKQQQTQIAALQKQVETKEQRLSALEADLALVKAEIALIKKQGTLP